MELFTVAEVKHGTRPDMRLGHTTTLLPDKNLFIFGGFDGTNTLNDSLIYDITKKEWIKLKTEGNPPNPRAGHTSTLITETSEIFIFGGTGPRDYKDLWVIDTKKKIWNKPKTTSSVKVYISGDLLIGDKLLNKILKIDNDEEGEENKELEQLLMEGNLIQEQTELNNENNEKFVSSRNLFPAARSRHTCIYREKQLYLFGGGSSNKIYDDFWVLNVDNYNWDKLKISGEKPTGRWGHTMNYYDKNDKIYLFGGAYQNKTLNDLFEFDPKNLIWKKIELSTKYGSIAPRASHSFNIYKDYFFILWGGDNNILMSEFLIISLEKLQIIKREKFKKPTARCTHTSTLVDHQIFIYGGGGGMDEKPGIEYQEIFILDIEKFLSQDFLKHKENVHSRTTSNPNHNLNQQNNQSESKESDVTIQRKRSSSKDIKYSREQQIFSDKDTKEMTNWLVSLGLGRYASLFISEEIDLECLPLLTEADLFRIGVSKYGPRKKILAAAEELANDSKKSIPPPPPTKPKEQSFTYSNLPPNMPNNSSNSNQQLIDSIQKLTNYIENFKEAVNDLTVTLTIMSSSFQNQNSNQNQSRLHPSNLFNNASSFSNQQNDEIQTPSYKYQIHPKPKSNHKNKRNSAKTITTNEPKISMNKLNEDVISTQRSNSAPKTPTTIDSPKVEEKKHSKTSILDDIILPQPQSKSWFEKMQEEEENKK
eukprot:gene4605-7987_t